MSHLHLLRPTLRTTTTTSLRTLIRPFHTSPTHALARMQLIGRLAAPPEAVATSTGRDVIRYAIGTSHGPQDARKTSWFQVASFEEAGPRRDLLLGLPKGTLVYVDAEGRMRSYENAEGKMVSRLDLVQQKLDVLSRPRNAEGVDEAAQAEAAMG